MTAADGQCGLRIGDPLARVIVHDPDVNDDHVVNITDKQLVRTQHRDVDGDGDADEDDINIVLASLGASCIAAPNAGDSTWPPSPVPLQPVFHIFGDADHDGFVGRDDLDLVISQFDRTCEVTADTTGDRDVTQADILDVLCHFGLLRADITGDCDVDGDDFFAVHDHWGPCGSLCPADIASSNPAIFGPDGMVDSTDQQYVLDHWNQAPGHCDEPPTAADLASIPLEYITVPYFDCNHNLIPDECEIARGWVSDVNDDGIPDTCGCAGDTNASGAAAISDMVMEDNTIGLVYPGALLWTKPLLQGDLDALRQIPGRPTIRVTMSGLIPPDNVEVDPTFEFDGSFRAFDPKMSSIVRKFATSEPRVTVAIAQMSDLKTSLLKLGMSANYWFAKVGGRLEQAKSESRSFATLAIDQVYFTASADMPDIAGQFPPALLGNEAVAKYVLPQVQEKGEIGWVRKVSYGRRVLLTISSTASQDELNRALRLSAGLGALGFEGQIDEGIRHVWSSMDIRAAVIGGKVTPSLIDAMTGNPAMFLDNVNKFLKDTIELDRRTGIPAVSFEVRYADDDSVVTNYETTEFAGKIPLQRMAKAGKVAVSDAGVGTGPENSRLIQADWEVDSDDWTGVDVSFGLSVGENGRAVILHVVWNVYELESDQKFEGDNTQIQSERNMVLWRVPDGDRRTISGIEGVVMAGSRRANFKGELHSAFSFGDVESMRNISVRVDGPGGNDQPQQMLSAVISFTVALDRER